MFAKATKHNVGHTRWRFKPYARVKTIAVQVSLSEIDETHMWTIARLVDRITRIKKMQTWGVLSLFSYKSTYRTKYEGTEFIAASLILGTYLADIRGSQGIMIKI